MVGFYIFKHINMCIYIFIYIYIYIQNSHTDIYTDSKCRIQSYTVGHNVVNVPVLMVCSSPATWLKNCFRLQPSCFDKTLRFPKAEKVLLCVLLIFSDWAESKKEPWLRPPLHQTRPGRDRVLPEVFSPPYCFQYCCCVWCGGSNQGERRRCNWEALTEFNKGEGFNRRSRLLPRLFSVHRRGQKRSWGPKWMIIGVAMVCGW